MAVSFSDDKDAESLDKRYHWKPKKKIEITVWIDSETGQFTDKQN